MIIHQQIAGLTLKEYVKIIAERSERNYATPDCKGKENEYEVERSLTYTYRWWRPLLAEVVSTGILICLGCASCIQFKENTELGDIVLPPGDKAQPALAFGFIVMANMCAFGTASGAHMNPAVTLGAVLYGELEVLPALGYLIAQILGASLGFHLLLSAMSMEKTDGICLTLPAKTVSPMGAVVLEAAITATMQLAICSEWVIPASQLPDHAAPIKIALVVVGLIYSMGTATGASLNPARSFGPALLQGIWQDHWVYWVGPLLGAALGSLFHRYVLIPFPTPQRPTASKTTPSESHREPESRASIPHV